MNELPNLLDTPHLLALAAALGWASGFRLYAVVFLTGAAGYMGWVPLPAGLHLLQLGDALADVLQMLGLDLIETLFPLLALRTGVGALRIGSCGLAGLR